MALTKGVNSYATVAEADAYFGDRLDVAAWTDAGDTQKAQALVTATAMLNDFNWIGVAISETQDLAFPRQGSYFEPRLGLYKELDTTVPKRVIDATYELAYHLLNNDGLLDDVGSVQDINLSGVALNSITGASRIPGTTRRLIKPLLVNGGSSPWWRAN